MSTPLEIAQVVAMLKSGYPNFSPIPPDERGQGGTVEIYRAILEDLPFDSLRAGTLAYMAEPHQFAPSPGEIRDRAMKLDATAAGIPSAIAAYEEAVRKPTIGERDGDLVQVAEGVWDYPRKPILWSHPLVEQVAKMMGWPKEFPGDNPAVDRAQFQRFYDAELARLMENAGRLPVLQQYIDSKSQSGNRLEGFGDVAKRLPGA